jgi:glycosyltransferase involved in cell wall biosynthesis
VCIPTYNRSGLLRSSLQSVLWQSLRDIEVIVSDNASTDDTEDVVRSLGDPRVSTTATPRTSASSRT